MRTSAERVLETFPDLARRILDRPARLGRTRLVAVDGPSGAGKTVFAGRLAAALAGSADGFGKVPVLHTDDLLDGWADQLTFWPRLDEWVLAPLRSGQPGRYRRYSWIRREFTPRWIPVPPAPVIIIEGVSSARAAITPELTLSVFVTAPAELRLDRVLTRDGATLLPYLTQWRRGERRHFAADATADRAGLVVDGAPGGALGGPAGGGSAPAFDPDIHYVRLC
jgi:uridine kinase